MPEPTLPSADDIIASWKSSPSNGQAPEAETAAPTSTVAEVGDEQQAEGVATAGAEQTETPQEDAVDYGELAPDPNDSPADAAAKAHWRKKFDQLHNKRAKEQKATQPDKTLEDQAKAFQMLVQAPNAGEILDAMRKRFGIEPKGDKQAIPPEIAEYRQKRAEKLKSVDPSAVETFEAMMEDFIERRVLPRFNQREQELMELREEREKVRKEAIVKSLPEGADKYLPEAEALVEKTGGALTLDQAIYALAKDKLVKPAPKRQQQETATTVFTSSAPADNIAPSPSGKNGTFTDEDIIQSYRQRTGAQPRASFGLGSLVRR